MKKTGLSRGFMGASPSLSHCRAKAANSIASGSGFAPSLETSHICARCENRYCSIRPLSHSDESQNPFAPERLRRGSNPLYVVSPVKKKKQERSFGNLPTLIFLDNEHVHPVRSMDSPKFFLSNVEHNTLFLKVAK